MSCLAASCQRTVKKSELNSLKIIFTCLRSLSRVLLPGEVSLEMVRSKVVYRLVTLKQSHRLARADDYTTLLLEDLHCSFSSFISSVALSICSYRASLCFSAFIIILRLSSLPRCWLRILESSFFVSYRFFSSKELC